MSTSVLHINAEGFIQGLSVIGFHGYVEPDETPARLGPVYVDAQGCHARIAEVGLTQVRIESYPPPLPAEGPLPGDGTRAGPWAARVGYTIIAIGPEEKRRGDALRRHAARENGRVAGFLAWFVGSELRSSELCCERREDSVALWYCAEREGFTLRDSIVRVAKAELVETIRQGSSFEAIEDVAWWLSRAAVAEADIFLAGASLRRAMSPHWEDMLRAILRLPRDRDLHADLAKAEETLKTAVETRTPGIKKTSYSSRDRARQLFYPDRKEAA
jgi:hypothetical protein